MLLTKVPAKTFIFLLFSIFQTLDGTGKFEVKFMRYINPGGKGSNGNCCETHFSFLCRGSCDHRFTVCVDKNIGSDHISYCPLGKKHTGEVSDQDHIGQFYSSIGGTPNPMVFNVNSMPSIIRLKFEVVDVDDHNSWDHVDNLINVISAMNVARSKSVSHFTTYEFSSRTTLTIGFRAYCDLNYYSRNCSVHCLEQNNNNGHNRCNKETGEKICLTGWHGPLCLNDIKECSSDPCNNGATCVELLGGYECKCKNGFAGWHCDEMTSKCALDPCLNNGTCVSENTSEFSCTCATGWTGKTCNVTLDECYHNPCEHDGTCTLDNSISGYICECEEEYGGPNCKQKLVDFDGPPMEILLFGTIEDDNTLLQDQLNVGLIDILKHLGGYLGFIRVRHHTKAYLKDRRTNVTRVMFVAAEDGGSSLIPLSAIKKIFDDHTDEEINPYLPLPLYTGVGQQAFTSTRTVTKVTSWAADHWYVVLLLLLAVVVVVVCGVFFFIRRRRRRKDYKDPITMMPAPNGNLNVAFENDMYLQMNRANAQTEGLTRVNDNPLFQAPVTPAPTSTTQEAPHRLLLNGMTTTDSCSENPYMEPTKQYDTPPSRAAQTAQHSFYENSCLDTRVTAGNETKDNFYTQFDNLQGYPEENHYHDIDELALEKMALDEQSAASSDNEDDITAIKMKIKADEKTAEEERAKEETAETDESEKQEKEAEASAKQWVEIQERAKQEREAEEIAKQMREAEEREKQMREAEERVKHEREAEERGKQENEEREMTKQEKEETEESVKHANE